MILRTKVAIASATLIVALAGGVMAMNHKTVKNNVGLVPTTTTTSETTAVGTAPVNPGSTDTLAVASVNPPSPEPITSPSPDPAPSLPQPILASTTRCNVNTPVGPNSSTAQTYSISTYSDKSVVVVGIGSLVSVSMPECPGDVAPVSQPAL